MFFAALTVLVTMPMYDTSNFALADTFSEKLPSMLVTVPVLVPTTLMLAPITGEPSSEEVTVPET